MPREPSSATTRRKKSVFAALLRCSCFDTAASEDDQVMPGASSSAVHIHKSASRRITGSPSAKDRSSRRNGTLQHTAKPSGSAIYSDSDWQDAVSNLSSSADHAALLEECQSLVKELSPFKAPPWIPEPPLAFGTPNLQFIRVPAHTGFAAYWERDNERTTPFPQPIDVMLGAPYLVQKTHASIPGIWIQETSTCLTITATPKFIPPFLPISGYKEYYDKSNTTEPSWVPRRDMKMGRAWGKLYMTADGNGYPWIAINVCNIQSSSEPEEMTNGDVACASVHFC